MQTKMNFSKIEIIAFATEICIFFVFHILIIVQVCKFIALMENGFSQRTANEQLFEECANVMMKLGPFISDLDRQQAI